MYSPGLLVRSTARRREQVSLSRWKKHVVVVGCEVYHETIQLLVVAAAESIDNIRHRHEPKYVYTSRDAQKPDVRPVSGPKFLRICCNSL